MTRRAKISLCLSGIWFFATFIAALAGRCKTRFSSLQSAFPLLKTRVETLDLGFCSVLLEAGDENPSLRESEFFIIGCLAVTIGGAILVGWLTYKWEEIFPGGFL